MCDVVMSNGYLFTCRIFDVFLDEQKAYELSDRFNQKDYGFFKFQFEFSKEEKGKLLDIHHVPVKGFSDYYDGRFHDLDIFASELSKVLLSGTVELYLAYSGENGYFVGYKVTNDGAYPIKPHIEEKCYGCFDATMAYKLNNPKVDIEKRNELEDFFSNYVTNSDYEPTRIDGGFTNVTLDLNDFNEIVEIDVADLHAHFHDSYFFAKMLSRTIIKGSVELRFMGDDGHLWGYKVTPGDVDYLSMDWV
jgi:hypothetical protein